jgi:anti-sigma factor RsiW
MTNGHLTDETLQAFLLDETQEGTAAAHLSACADCREKLENYQRLVVGIKKMTPESFAFDVTAVVMNNIVQYERQESRKQELVFWGLLSLLIVVITAFSIPFLPQIRAIFSAIPVFPALLIGGTGAVVLLFLVADINRQYKIKEEKIFQNKLQPIR